MRSLWTVAALLLASGIPARTQSAVPPAEVRRAVQALTVDYVHSVDGAAITGTGQPGNGLSGP